MPAFSRENEEIEEIYLRNVDLIYRICFLYLKNPADTEDAVSETFLRLLKSAPEFRDRSHERAWLIKVASNICRSSLTHWWRRRVDIDAVDLPDETRGETGEVLQKVCDLPDKYKTVLYLYYFEGYKSAEIAEMLDKNHSTVRSLLKKGRELLKLELEEEVR